MNFTLSPRAALAWHGMKRRAMRELKAMGAIVTSETGEETASVQPDGTLLLSARMAGNEISLVIPAGDWEET